MSRFQNEKLTKFQRRKSLRLRQIWFVSFEAEESGGAFA
jgi:hypothetical protein